MVEISVSTKIFECPNKRAMMPDLLAFLNGLELSNADRAARIQREMAQLAALPDELTVRVDLAGYEYTATIMDIEVCYATFVAARLAKEPAEREYVREVRNWLNRVLTEEAQDDGVEILPLFGFRAVEG